jgi:hypothetical protein
MEAVIEARIVKNIKSSDPLACWTNLPKLQRSIRKQDKARYIIFNTITVPYLSIAVQDTRYVATKPSFACLPSLLTIYVRSTVGKMVKFHATFLFVILALVAIACAQVELSERQVF